MIIEIGTSDFNTLAGECDGLFIEPVKYYFDRLPKCNKENVAISDKNGEIDIYYVTDDIISKYNMPNWIRGCNSVNSPHPTTLKYIDSSLIKKKRVKTLKIKSLIDKYDIKEIHYLKIDTEGHDCIILNNFLDEVDILPDRIKFENNLLSDPKSINDIVNRLRNLNYEIYYQNKDIYCKRRGNARKFILTYEMTDLIKLQRPSIKTEFGKRYFESVASDWNDIKQYVNGFDSVIDIGCGIAGIDCFLAEFNRKSTIYLLDENKISEKVKYGYHETSSFYNNLHLSKKFLEINGITNKINLLTPNDRFDNIEVDLIISIVSWGFHYPISTYINMVNHILSQAGIIIIDLRNDYFEESVKVFDDNGFKVEKIISIGEKSKRALIRRK